MRVSISASPVATNIFWCCLTIPDDTHKAARGRINELLKRRIAQQPLQLPNAGSVFRNPAGDHAARLIEAAGLKGLSVGSALVSEKHANFIVNRDGKATASAIEMLIGQIQATVREKFAVDLVREVRIVGNATSDESIEVSLDK